MGEKPDLKRAIQSLLHSQPLSFSTPLVQASNNLPMVKIRLGLGLGLGLKVRVQGKGQGISLLHSCKHPIIYVK
jgi:hypothetical protein